LRQRIKSTVCSDNTTDLHKYEMIAVTEENGTHRILFSIFLFDRRH